MFLITFVHSINFYEIKVNCFHIAIGQNSIRTRNRISAGVKIIRGHNNYTRGRASRKLFNFSRENLTVPKIVAQCRKLAHSLSLYIVEHTRLVPKTEELSAANQNRAQKTPILRQPIRIEHAKTLQLLQPIRIEYYVTRIVSHSESSITLPESSRLGWKTLLGSRLESARYSLS